MRLNGNLVLNAGGSSEIQNAVIQRVAVLPAFVSAEKGRFVFLTTDNKVYFNDGSIWSPIATGGNAATLQTEVDTLEAALGALVGTDGSFYAAGASLTNVTAATSITDVLAQLDAAISAANTAAAAEAAARAAADATLTADLAAEVTARTNGDATLTAALAAETTARIAGDATNAAAVSAETTRATTAEAALQAAIDAEAATRGTADTALQAAIDAEATARAAADATELTARIAADVAASAAASDQIATETTARLAGDAALNARADGLQAELDLTQLNAGLNVDGTYTAPANTTYLGATTSLKDASVALDAAIYSEVTARAAAVVALGSQLANEAQLRADGDANLQSQLQAWVSVQLAGNAANDLAEASARIAADAALQAELDATQAAIGLDTAGHIIPVTGTNYLDGITSVFSGAFALDTAIKANADAIGAETTARSAADAVFQSNLDTERDARIAGDLALQTELNTTQAGAGLEASGAYAAPTGSNYLGSAISLKDADFILDAQVKVNTDAIAANAASGSAALTAETAARTAADTALQAALDAETTARTSADAALTASLATETAAREAADTALTASVNAEVTARTAADAALQASVDTINTKLGKIYFLYDGASATSHVVGHALNQQFCNVTVVDAATNEVIIPQSIVFDSANQLTVTLNSALAIKVVVMGIGPAYTFPPFPGGYTGPLA